MLTATARPRGFVANRMVLELDGPGNYVGTLQSVEGGAMRAALMTERFGTERVAYHLPGRPQYEDLTLQVGMAMVPRFWNWLRSSLDHDPQRRNGAIVALDFNNQQRWRRTFSRALISEIRFPALDGSAAEPAGLTVKLAVEHIAQEPANGRYHAELEEPGEWRRQGRFSPSSFTFQVDQLAQLGLRTGRIEAFIVKQGIIDCPVGRDLEVRKAPGILELPNLEVSVPEADAAPWIRWYEECVREGKSGNTRERTGHISYLGRGANQRRPLMTLNFYGMGIHAIKGAKFDSRQQQLGKLKVELSCQSMGLDIGEGNVRV